MKAITYIVSKYAVDGTYHNNKNMLLSSATRRFIFLTLVAAICYDSKLMSSVAFINVPPPPATHHRRRSTSQSLHKSYNQGSPTTSLLLSNSDTNNNDFIRSLLTNNVNDDDPYSKYTHQIAIPLGDAAELHSVLHAIQTSLVRDCPRLIRACVMPALLRLPLLYVDGNSLGMNLGRSDQNVETILESVVHRSIMEVVYGQEAEIKDAFSSSTTPSSDVSLVEPILLPFSGLELQGDDNSVLYAVGRNINDKNSKKKRSRNDGEDEDDGVMIVDDWSDDSSSKICGWETLEALVNRIQSILESEYDCKTQWPNDEAQGEELDYDDPLVAAIKRKQKKWRPRVPFVRLPTDFYQELEKSLAEKVNRGLSDEEEELSPIDMGLDGISPLFWYDAWGEDDILPEPGVRMRSVAIYRRMVPGGGEAESSFYVAASDALQSWKRGLVDAPSSNSDEKSMDLPSGDTKLMARERRERAIAMERMGEDERRAERDWEEGKAQWINNLDDDESDSEDFTEMDIGMEMGDVTVEGEAAYASPWAERGVTNDDIDSLGDDSIEATAPSVDPVSETNAQTNKSPKELPSIEDNPIFKRLREGRSQITAQGQASVQPLDSSSTEEESLPPYPSDPHFTGIWSIVSSPFGTGSLEGNGLSSASDNFIFRVDGVVAGGPILNAEYQQKAAGGSWMFFEAQLRRSSSAEISVSPITQTRLRVRLLVPPEKSQTLVIEGEMNRIVGPDVMSSSSSSDAWRMASGGMLDGMSSKLIQDEDNTDVRPPRGQSQDAMIFCRGEAWLEDTEDGLNRKKLGPIALMKLKTPDRNKLIYTVPSSKGPPGDDDNDEE